MGGRKSKLSVPCLFLNFTFSPETMMAFGGKAFLVVLLIYTHIPFIYVCICVCIYMYILAAERLIVLSDFLFETSLCEPE